MPSNTQRSLQIPGAMRAEHAELHARLEAAAHLAGRLEYERLVDEIRLHARMEEQVNYPAAILVGELVRTKVEMAGHPCCAR